MAHKPKILVTGGMGYLGSHTIVALQQAGYDAISADNHSNSQPDVADRIASITGIKPTNYVIDVCERQSLEQLFLEEGPISGIIHMAAFKSVAESVQMPLKYYANNLVGLLQVLHCAQKFDVNYLVFSSTCTIYGEPETLPVDEAHPINPLSPYGKSKAIGEQLLREFVERSNLKAMSLRFFNPVGAHPSAELGEYPRGVPSNLLPYLAQTAAGIHPYLRIWGNSYPTPDGTCIRDFIHVCDLAEVHLKALEFMMTEGSRFEGYDAVNIGTGIGVSVLEMLETFQSVNQIEVPFQICENRPGDIVSMYASSEKAYNLFGWKPRFTLHDMVSTAWQWQNAILNSKQRFSRINSID